MSPVSAYAEVLMQIYAPASLRDVRWVRSSGDVRVALAVFMRTGFETWWGSVSALVSRRITVACERWMRAMDWMACRADRICICMAEGEMTSQMEAVGSVISAVCMSEGFWKCDRRLIWLHKAIGKLASV
jgi:hypothetical protein